MACLAGNDLCVGTFSEYGVIIYHTLDTELYNMPALVAQLMRVRLVFRAEGSITAEFGNILSCRSHRD